MSHHLVRGFTLDQLLGENPMLSSESQTFIRAELDRSPGPMGHRAELNADAIRLLAQELDLHPVWSRDGVLVYSLNVEGTILVFAIAPDIEKDLVPVDALEREWVVCSSIPDLIDQMVAWAKGVRELEGETPKLYVEDHPEERAIGFYTPDTNRTWLLSTATVVEGLEAQNAGDYAFVPHLIQSNMGRIELASRIANGALITQTEFMQQWGKESMSAEELAAAMEQGLNGHPRRKSDIIIDLMSGRLADRFKARYLKGGSRAAEA